MKDKDERKEGGRKGEGRGVVRKTAHRQIHVFSFCPVHHFHHVMAGELVSVMWGRESWLVGVP